MGNLKLQGLYAISDAKTTPYSHIDSWLIPAIKGGVTILQLRDKSLSDEQLLPYAKQMQAICHAHDVTFIINDRVQLAAQIGADGVHIGRDDSSFDKVKKIFTGIIGVSCYGNVHRALQYEAQGADYVAFGGCFPSSTKPEANTIDIDILSVAKMKLSIPICVIGGITTKNAHILTPYWCDMMALVSGLWNNDNIEQTANQLCQIIAR